MKRVCVTVTEEKKKKKGLRFKLFSVAELEQSLDPNTSSAKNPCQMFSIPIHNVRHFLFSLALFLTLFSKGLLPLLSLHLLRLSIFPFLLL